MSAKKDIEAVDLNFQAFLEKSMPQLAGKNSKEVMKHLNKLFKDVSDGKSKKLIKRVEKEIGVSLAKQFKDIEKAEKARWGKKFLKR